jgi:hypothetical protein
MTLSNPLSDSFLFAQPFGIFGGLQPGYSGVEINFDEQGSRLFTLPNDISAEGIRDALLAEFDFYTQFRAALTQSLIASPFKRGWTLPEAEIENVDFAVKNRKRMELFAVYAAAGIDGINQSFINRLVAGSENVNILILVTSKWPKDVALSDGALSPKIEIFPGSDISRLAEITVDYFYDKISNDGGLEAPARAAFPHKQRSGKSQSV